MLPCLHQNKPPGQPHQLVDHKGERKAPYGLNLGQKGQGLGFGVWGSGVRAEVLVAQP